MQIAIRIKETMARHRSGIKRTDLSKESGVSDGESLTRALRELEQCDFIRQYSNVKTPKNGCFYQLTDPFILFCLYFLREGRTKSWQTFIKSPEYYAWRGNAFETVCLLHIPQIKAALGISGVVSTEYSWRSRRKEGGAQIDLLIDRRDDVINLCEMKYTDSEFEITGKYKKELINKLELFTEEVCPKKSVHITLITSNGLKRNANADVVQNVVDSDRLFRIISD